TCGASEPKKPAGRGMSSSTSRRVRSPMADPAALMARIRAHGANVAEGDKLKLVNANRLPAGALDYIKANGRDLAGWLEREAQEAQFEERAAIIEFDGG